ncbi:MAG: RDD family protein [Jatrophihabitans sp.]
MTNYPPAPPPGQEPMGPGVPPGMYYDPQTELTLPNGVQLASHGRRIGAYFLAIPLAIVTLGIGYLIWGLIVWGKGTSPALQVLGMKVWRPQENRPASWGSMALRNIVGGILQGILGFITGLVSLVLFLSGNQRKTIPDHIASTVVVYDPNKILEPRK